MMKPIPGTAAYILNVIDEAKTCVGLNIKSLNDPFTNILPKLDSSEKVLKPSQVCTCSRP